MADFEELSVNLPDGYTAYARLWSPEAPRGAVLYHHGIQSHAGWYETSPRQLCDAGFAVLQVDRRGCGRNSRDRGHAESERQLVDDTLAGRNVLLARTGFSGYHVIGVSWGGKLAVTAYVHDPNGVTSLSLVTPGLFPRIVASGEEKAKIGFAMIYEPLTLFDIPLNDPEMFTSNSEWQRFFRDDPLTLRQCSAAFYLASRRMDRTVAKLSAAPPVPVHLFVAGDERIVDNAATIRFIRELNWPGSRISTYSGARHSLEFESCRDNYFRDLVEFVRGLNDR
jgi:alpha-beta hydrolase superfamily lysophospholipase